MTKFVDKSDGVISDSPNLFADFNIFESGVLVSKEAEIQKSGSAENRQILKKFY